MCLRLDTILLFAFPLCLCIAGIAIVASSENRRLKEDGHLILSVVPFLHILMSYAFAFYVRIGFGSWPRSCIDNPELPLIGFLGPVLLLTVFWINALPILWLGWLGVRLWQRLKTRLWLATGVFLAGYVLLLALVFVLDPWGFWLWAFD